ncbi:major facilitator superfamily domain-containing protein [Truncatella angustata]|uniref:Major facilitator superfamily domain-containing protein n=1 Tax=Truncatella angustata TaxID=152316 RepID=A0A9P8UBI5_9PEZI|nr:major facilitator superfamily domain-containing protein [Truncatella angustata]KAH6645426.1 major facilitator superfamily domain-containing protein [Truncatella angustata]
MHSKPTFVTTVAKEYPVVSNSQDALPTKKSELVVSNQFAEKPSTPGQNADMPITDLYLTFDTILPVPGYESAPQHDSLPPCPDLSRYGNPTKLPNTKKNVMLFLSCIATCLTAYTAGAYSPPAGLLATEFGVSRTAVLTGITLFTVGFGIAPMVLAPFSEVNGRYPVFVVSGIVFVVFQAVCGVVTNLGGMLVARFLCGVGGSVFSTMVGGVIADLWVKEERNTPMALYSGAVLIGTGLGPLDASLMVYRLRGDGVTGAGARWRWVFWHQVIADAVLVIALTVFFSESRGSVLLRRKAKKLNQWYEALEKAGVFGVWIKDPANLDIAAVGQESFYGDDMEKAVSTTTWGSEQAMAASGFRLERVRWLLKEDEQHASLVTMITVSLIRPFHLLFTEPAVFFFSLWVSFAWAVLYLTFGSIPLVFSRQHGFNLEQSGYIFIAMIVGSIIATAMGVYQESLLKYPKWQRKTGAVGAAEIDHDGSQGRFWSFMRRRFPVEAPESRIYFTCLSSVLLPLGLYMFGFASKPSIHWIVPALAIALATMGIYTIYLATFNYLADSYHSYASSALAAQSFCRNMLGGAFPLVVGPLFINLGESAAGGLLGAIATALTIVPWVLAIYGEKIRRRSKFAVALEHEQ